jgi:endo-1,4-beta-xylanase
LLTWLSLCLLLVSCTPGEGETLGGDLESDERAGTRPAAAVEVEEWVPVEGGEDLTLHPSWQCVESVEVVDGRLVIEAGDGYVTPIHGDGPYLQASGDFGLAATVQAATEDTAALVAAGALPQGRWWEGVKRLDMGLGAGQISIHFWDGTSPEPALSRFYAARRLSDQTQLEMRRIEDTLVFLVDGNEVGRLVDPGVFPDDKVYLGANVAPGNTLSVERLTVQARHGQESEVQIVDPAPQDVPVPSGPRLRELAETRDVQIGAAVAPGALRCEPAYGGVLGREFNIVTTENALKFGPVHPERERYDFRDADAIVDFAEENGMLVRGHTLVWHNQNPQWLEEGDWTRDELSDILREHITTVVSRYRGRIAAWDVVNEAIDEDGELRDTLWLRVIGPEYIAMAFRWAHEADPEARLYYNDYACEGLSCKSNAIYVMVQDLQEQDVPIHGVGLQMHVTVNDPPPPQDVQANLERLGELGLEVQITEMDVRIRGEPTEKTLAQQAEVYGDMMDVCLKAGNCSAYVLWGFTDRHSWVPGFFSGWGSALIFDESYAPKPAYDTLREVLADD